MRRLMPIAAFVLFLALPLWAQRGGGHGGGFSGHAGFSGGHAGGGHISGGMRSGMGSSRGFSSRGTSRGFTRGPSFSQRSARGPFLHNGFRGNRFGRGIGNRRSGNRFRTFGFRNNCYGFACRGFGYPWAYGAYYDPFWWGDSGSSYDEDYERDRALANDMNEQSLEQQQMLRQEEADGDQDSYSSRYSGQRSDPSGNTSSSSQMQQGAPIIPATVLVFRDQRREDIQNYAIVGQTLWNFAPKHTEKIPLSDLDMTATAKANEDRGVIFRVPANGEAQ
jgi:hypothetical protein